MTTSVSFASWSILLLGFAGTGAGSYLLTRLLHIPRGHRASAVFTISVSFLTVTALLTGQLHRLSRGPLLIAVGIWAALNAATYALAHVRRTRAGSRGEWAEHSAHAAARSRPGRIMVVVASGLLMAVNIVVYSWRAVLAVRLPAQGYDALYYHLVNIARWANTHSLARPFLGLGRNGHDPTFLTQADSFPKNTELIGGWIAVLTNSMTPVGLTQLLFVAWLGIATTGCARAVGIRADVARLAGVLVTLCPAVISQSDQLYVDIARTAPIVAAFQFLVLAFPRDAVRTPQISRTCMVLSGAALGFGVGVKSSNLVFIPILAVVAITFLAAQRQRAREAQVPVPSSATKTMLPLLACAAVPTMVLGTYWYARTWINWGTPLWPYSIGPVHGRASFSDGGGILQTYHTNSTAAAVVKSWWLAVKTFDGPLRGDAPGGSLGVFFLCVGLPSILFVLVRLSDNSRIVWAVVLPMFVGTLAAPAAYNTRYSMLLTVSAVIALAAGLEFLLDRSTRVADPQRSNRRWRLLAGVGGALLLMTILSLADAWDASRYGNWDAVAGGTTTPTLQQLIRAVRAPEHLRLLSGTSATDRPVMENVPAHSTIGFFADAPPLLTYDLLGPTQTNVLKVLGPSFSTAAITAQKAHGLKYLFVTDYAALANQLGAATGAAPHGYVTGGAIVDLDPNFRSSLPTPAQAAHILGAHAHVEDTTPTKVIATALGTPRSDGCGAQAWNQATRTWTTLRGTRLSAVMCRYGTDAPADQLATQVLDRAATHGWSHAPSPDPLTNTFKKTTNNGRLKFLITIRRPDYVEILKGHTTPDRSTALDKLAQHLGPRLGTYS